MDRAYRWFVFLMFGPLVIGGVGMAVFFYREFNNPKMQAVNALVDTVYEHRQAGDAEAILTLLQEGGNARFDRAAEKQSFKAALAAVEKRFGKLVKVAEVNYQYIDDEEFTDVDVKVKLKLERRVNFSEELKIRYHHAKGVAQLTAYQFEGFR